MEKWMLIIIAQTVISLKWADVERKLLFICIYLMKSYTVQNECKRKRRKNIAVADPGFARGRTMAIARSAILNGVLGEEPPAGSSRGRAPGADQEDEAP